MEIIDTEEIFFPSGGNIAAIATTAPLNKQKNISQKYGGISPLCDIGSVEISASAELGGERTKLTQHWWKLIKKRYSISQDIISRIWKEPQR